WTSVIPVNLVAVSWNGGNPFRMWNSSGGNASPLCSEFAIRVGDGGCRRRPFGDVKRRSVSSRIPYFTRVQHSLVLWTSDLGIRAPAHCHHIPPVGRTPATRVHWRDVMTMSRSPD